MIWENTDKWLVCGIFIFPKNESFLGELYVFGKIRIGIGNDVGYSYRALKILQEVTIMRKKNFKGRCEKRMLDKCKDVCRTYDAIQYAYADILSDCSDIVEFRCNVFLEGLEEGEYTTDFVCTKQGGDLMVRECVFRKFLTKPLTVKLLEASRLYWLRHGVSDWGLVIDEEK